jgi:hypothetical protein
MIDHQALEAVAQRRRAHGGAQILLDCTAESIERDTTAM